MHSAVSLLYFRYCITNLLTTEQANRQMLPLRRSLSPEHNETHMPMGQVILTRVKRLLLMLVRSSETPKVAVVEEALERYREFLAQWRLMRDQNEASKQAPMDGVKP